MTDGIRRIVKSPFFERVILGVILLAAVLVGMETYPSLVAEYGDTLHLFNEIVLWIFVAEAVVKMAQYGTGFLRYFRDPWNAFDFSIVAICFLPVSGSHVAVLRLARIARSLRLLTTVPRLQVIVAALLKSIPSMGYVGILLLLNFYVYAVMGVFLFRENDPVHFKDLETAMLSLFRVVTLEDWTDVMYIQMYGSDVYAYANTTGITPVPRAMPIIGTAYFVSFVMLGTMIMLNLFIGVVISSMDEAQQEHSRALIEGSGRPRPEADDVAAIEEHVERLRADLARLKSRLASNRAKEGQGSTTT